MKKILDKIWLGIPNLFDKYVLYTGLGQTFNGSSQPMPSLFTHCAPEKVWPSGVIGLKYAYLGDFLKL